MITLRNPKNRDYCPLAPTVLRLPKTPRFFIQEILIDNQRRCGSKKYNISDQVDLNNLYGDPQQKKHEVPDVDRLFWSGAKPRGLGSDSVVLQNLNGYTSKIRRYEAAGPKFNQDKPAPNPFFARSDGIALPPVTDRVKRPPTEDFSHTSQQHAKKTCDNRVRGETCVTDGQDDVMEYSVHSDSLPGTPQAPPHRLPRPNVIEYRRNVDYAPSPTNVLIHGVTAEGDPALIRITNWRNYAPVEFPAHYSTPAWAATFLKGFLDEYYPLSGFKKSTHQQIRERVDMDESYMAEDAMGFEPDPQNPLQALKTMYFRLRVPNNEVLYDFSDYIYSPNCPIKGVKMFEFLGDCKLTDLNRFVNESGLKEGHWFEIGKAAGQCKWFEPDEFYGHHPIEIQVFDWMDCHLLTFENGIIPIAPILQASFDIESYDPLDHFPRPDLKDRSVISISVVFSRLNAENMMTSDPNNLRKIPVLPLEKCDMPQWPQHTGKNSCRSPEFDAWTREDRASFAPDFPNSSAYRQLSKIQSVRNGYSNAANWLQSFETVKPDQLGWAYDYGKVGEEQSNIIKTVIKPAFCRRFWLCFCPDYDKVHRFRIPTPFNEEQGDGIFVLAYPNELMMLEAWRDLMICTLPSVIMGYNTVYDYETMYDRVSKLTLETSFTKIARFNTITDDSSSDKRRMGLIHVEPTRTVVDENGIERQVELDGDEDGEEDDDLDLISAIQENARLAMAERPISDSDLPDRCLALANADRKREYDAYMKALQDYRAAHNLHRLWKHAVDHLLIRQENMNEADYSMKISEPRLIYDLEKQCIRLKNYAVPKRCYENMRFEKQSFSSRFYFFGCMIHQFQPLIFKKTDTGAQGVRILGFPMLPGSANLDMYLSMMGDTTQRYDSYRLGDVAKAKLNDDKVDLKPSCINARFRGSSMWQLAVRREQLEKNTKFKQLCGAVGTDLEGHLDGDAGVLDICKSSSDGAAASFFSPPVASWSSSSTSSKRPTAFGLHDLPSMDSLYPNSFNNTNLAHQYSSVDELLKFCLPKVDPEYQNILQMVRTNVDSMDVQDGNRLPSSTALKGSYVRLIDKNHVLAKRYPWNSLYTHSKYPKSVFLVRHYYDIAAYNNHDCDCVSGLAVRFKVVPNAYTLGQMTQTSFSVGIIKGVSYRLLNYFSYFWHIRKMVLRRSSKWESLEYGGARVFNPKHGYYAVSVATNDYVGLYPSIMNAYNLDFGTIMPPIPVESEQIVDEKGEKNTVNYCIAPTREDLANIYGPKEYPVECNTPRLRRLYDLVNPRSSKHTITIRTDPERAPVTIIQHDPVAAPLTGKLGVLPECLATLKTARKEVKKTMGALPKDSDLYSSNDSKQIAIKVIMNAIYGISGMPNGPTAFVYLADVVTAFARILITWTANVLECLYNHGSQTHVPHEGCCTYDSDVPYPEGDRTTPPPYGRFDHTDPESFKAWLLMQDRFELDPNLHHLYDAWSGEARRAPAGQHMLGSTVTDLLTGEKNAILKMSDVPVVYRGIKHIPVERLWLENQKQLRMAKSRRELLEDSNSTQPPSLFQPAPPTKVLSNQTLKQFQRGGNGRQRFDGGKKTARLFTEADLREPLPTRHYETPAGFNGKTYWYYHTQSRSTAGAEKPKKFEIKDASRRKKKKKKNKKKLSFPYDRHATVCNDEVFDVRPHWPLGAPWPATRSLIPDPKKVLEVIYGDTDSVMLAFYRFEPDSTEVAVKGKNGKTKTILIPSESFMNEAMDFGRQTAAKINEFLALFRMKAVELGFEKMYTHFVIPTKKRYSAVKWLEPKMFDCAESKSMSKRDEPEFIKNLKQDISDQVSLYGARQTVAEFALRRFRQMIDAKYNDIRIFSASKKIAKDKYDSAGGDNGNNKATNVQGGGLVDKNQRRLADSMFLKGNFKANTKNTPAEVKSSWFSRGKKTDKTVLTDGSSVHVAANVRFGREFPGCEYQIGQRVPYVIMWNPDDASISNRSMVIEHWERLCERQVGLKIQENSDFAQLSPQEQIEQVHCKLPQVDLPYYLKAATNSLTEVMQFHPGFDHFLEAANAMIVEVEGRMRSTSCKGAATCSSTKNGSQSFSFFTARQSQLETTR